MKQHPFRLRLPHRLVSSVQFRFAVTFTILVAILLALMNTYPTRASRDIVFTEKQSALTNRAAVVSSSLSLLDNLTPDNTRQVLALLDLRDLTRIIVTDSEGLAVYDSASENNIRGKYVLYPELVRALDGQAVFYSHYTTGAFLSRAAMPVMNSGRTVGAVYVCESDGERAALIGSIQRRLATITIGIGAAALERYPSLFDKAVLSAPMIAPMVGMPTWAARIVVGVICGLGFGKSRVFGHADFDGNLNLDDYRGASEARIRWFHKQRLADVTCQTNAATFDWANQAMALSRAVLKPDMCGAIEAPVLLFQAGRDVWVLNGPQDDFVERVREGGGSIEKVRYSQSLHEIFSMPNAVLGSYLGKILDFLSAPNASLAE